MPVGTLVDQRRRAPGAVVLLVPREPEQALLHGLLRHQRRLEQVADLVAVPAAGSGAGAEERARAEAVDARLLPCADSIRSRRGGSTR